jgi:CheY-like chemotaxis protein
VEDNRDTADMLQMVIESAGYTARTAENGLAALQILEEWQPHSIVLDIGLPGLNGYEVTERVRARPETFGNPQIIAMSGYGQAADREKAFAAGVNAFLLKPAIVNDLLALLSTSR